MEKELLYLVIQGKLPLEAVDSTQLSPNAVIAYNTIKFILSRGDVAPLDLQKIIAVARQKYKPNKEALEFFKLLNVDKPYGPLLETVRDWSVVQRLATLATEQLVSGEYNIDALGKLLTVGGAGAVEQFIQPIKKPKAGIDKTFKLQTGISAIDRVIGGLNDELVIVSGRPKAGKSNFFVNLLANNPKVNSLYITVTDYDYDDLCNVMARNDSSLCTRKNLIIADFTGFSATVADVEQAIARVNPQLVICDRAEELTPLRRTREPRWEIKQTFVQLRRLAKKYGCTLFTDAQQSAEGEKDAAKDRGLASPSNMAEDKTQRLAALDLFIGLYRKAQIRETIFNIHGRRPGLPQNVVVKTDSVGRYL